MRLFGREPALWLEVVKAVVVLAATLVPGFGGDQQAAVVVVATGLFGLLTALTTNPPQLAAVTEFIQTLGVAVLAFGVNVPADMLSGVVLVSGTIVTLLQRGQVAPTATLARRSPPVPPAAHSG